MHLSIASKLMLAFLGLTLVVLIATLGLARWSFERGFLDYVNALEQTRLERLSPQLATLYVTNNKDWSAIGQRTLNRRLSPGYEPDLFLPPGLEDYHVPPPRGARPEGRPSKGADLTQQAQGPRQRDLGRPPEKPGFIPKGKRPPRSKLPEHDSPPTALFNMQGERIGGIPFTSDDVEIIEVPVEVEGEIVAILKSEPKRNFDSPIETAFARQQLITSGVIGVASLLLAALVSWWLTRLLLAPVRRIISSIRQLSAGDYSRKLIGGRDEFGRLMDDINHLSNTLDKNQSARRRWLADISHELRTPMSILTGEIEALKDGIRPFDQAQLHSLDQEIQRLRHLTDDLYQLSLSDIGGLRYELASLDFGECVNDSVNAHQAAAEKADITLSLSVGRGAIINADYKRLNQLLTNLLRNSLAYTNAGGVITLDLKREGDEAILTINDTPPGVTPAECEKLFEPLYRQDESRNRRSAGAGLGLAICRNIVEAHRGTITAAPSALGGLEMTIILPTIEDKV